MIGVALASFLILGISLSILLTPVDKPQLAILKVFLVIVSWIVILLILYG